MTTIYANVEKEHILISKHPLIASGGVGQCRVVFTFSDYWKGLQLAAIFADRQKKNFYRVLVDTDGSAVIPWEVLAKPGAFWMGVEGISGPVRYTSELVRYNIAPGPQEGGDPQPPTPGIYDQILGKLAELENKIAKLQSGGGSEGSSSGNNAGSIGPIVRLASFDSVYGITITDGQSLNVNAQALIYDGNGYSRFQHDFAIPIVESSEIVPVVSADGKHIEFRLAKNLTSQIESPGQRIDSEQGQNDTLPQSVPAADAI